MLLLPILRFPESELRHYAARYAYKKSAHSTIERFYELGPRQGYLTQGELAEIVDWKSSRRPELVPKNLPGIVEQVTRHAFSVSDPAERMRALVSLSGVGYPTASVISHFCVDPDDPIVDRRALSSLSIPVPSVYTADFWQQYVQICRTLAVRSGMSVRDVDKALWQYDFEHPDTLAPKPPHHCPRHYCLTAGARMSASA